MRKPGSGILCGGQGKHVIGSRWARSSSTRIIGRQRKTLRIEEINFVERHAKLAVTIEGVEEYDLSDDSEAGIRLTQKIRSRISGRSVDEVESYIRNLPEVSNAVISSWPFWARTIPELSENVKFRVKR